MNDKYRIDSHKLMYHPKRVSELLEGKDDWETAKHIYPLYIEISPAGSCNARCTFCAVDYIGYKTNFLDVGMLHERFIEMGSLGIKSIMAGGEGEPTLHPKINSIVQSAATAKIDISFTTNGTFLNRVDLSTVSWVKISLNAGTRETYSKIHRVKPSEFDKVISNLRDAVKRKGNCVIGAQMVLLPENQHEIETIKAIGEDIGLDYVVIKPYSQHKSSITTQYENFIPIIPENNGKLIARKEAIETKEIPYSKCQATPYIWAYLMATGDLYSCSAYLLDDRFNLGNLNTQSFQEIWHSEKRKANWEYVRNELDISECRVNCRMNQSNIYLNDLINGVPHANFI